MATWREQRAEKERVEKEREEAATAAKKQKLATLNDATSTPTTEQGASSSSGNVAADLKLPSLGLTDDESRVTAEDKRLQGHILRNQQQEESATVTIIKQVEVHSQKPASSQLALLKPTTTETVFKNQWLPHCSEGAESRSKIHEIYQVKPNPDIMQTFEAARTAIEDANPGKQLKTLFLFLGTTVEKADVILSDGVAVAFPGTVTLYADPVKAIQFAEGKQLFCCRVTLGTPDLHYIVQEDGSKYTMKWGKHVIATYLFKLV